MSNVKKLPAEFDVVVTKRDISTGVRDNMSYCPIAKASKRALKTKDILVDSAGILLVGVFYTIPQVAKDFINAYDSGEDVEPIMFTAVIW